MSYKRKVRASLPDHRERERESEIVQILRRRVTKVLLRKGSATNLERESGTKNITSEGKQ